MTIEARSGSTSLSDGPIRVLDVPITLSEGRIGLSDHGLIGLSDVPSGSQITLLSYYALGGPYQGLRWPYQALGGPYQALRWPCQTLRWCNEAVRVR